MSKKKQSESAYIQPITFSAPVVGTVLTVLSGLFFLLLMMCLPLVGPAGSVVPYSKANFFTFQGVLLLCLIFSVLALVSKWQRREADGSPMPWISIGLTGFCLIMFVVLYAGWLSI